MYVAGPQVLNFMYAAVLFAVVSTFTRGTWAFSSNFPKRPLKLIDLTSKLGEINDIEHNKDSKIYPQNKLF